VHLPRLLRLDGPRRGENAETSRAQEGSAVHSSITSRPQERIASVFTAVVLPWAVSTPAPCLSAQRHAQRPRPARRASVRCRVTFDALAITRRHGAGTLSFNDLIRSEQQRWRDREAESLGGPDVDHELELRRLLNGEVSWLRALQDLVHVCSGAPVHVR